MGVDEAAVEFESRVDATLLPSGEAVSFVPRESLPSFVQIEIGLARRIK